MAYSDIQNKVGQIQMANQILIAQAMSDEEKFKKKKELKKQVRDTPQQRRNKQIKNDPKFQGGSPGTVYVPPEVELDPTDQEIQEALQDEDMREGNYLNDLMKIGAGAAGFGGNILRMLINPLGGNALASTPQDGKIPTRLFYNRPYDQPDVFIKDEQMKEDAKERFKGLTGIDLAMDYEDALPRGGFIGTERTNIFVNDGGEAYIREPNGNFKFDGFYDPARHGPVFPRAQANDNMKIAKLPHSPPVEKIVLPNGKLMDSPLRFKTDQERIKFMEDFSRGYGRYS